MQLDLRTRRTQTRQPHHLRLFHHLRLLASLTTSFFASLATVRILARSTTIVRLMLMRFMMFMQMMLLLLVLHKMNTLVSTSLLMILRRCY